MMLAFMAFLTAPEAGHRCFKPAFLGDVIIFAAFAALQLIVGTAQSSGSQTGSHGPPGGHGAMRHGRILNKYICQGLILKYGLFEFFEFFTH